MAQLREYNGRYCESEYEYAFIGFLETEGWIYSFGNNISRTTKRDVLIAADFKKFIADTNPDLMEDEVTQIFDNVRLVGSESDFATLHKVYSWMVDGITVNARFYVYPPKKKSDILYLVTDNPRTIVYNYFYTS